MGQQITFGIGDNGQPEMESLVTSNGTPLDVSRSDEQVRVIEGDVLTLQVSEAKVETSNELETTHDVSSPSTSPFGLG